jgi:hypothetical protein
LLFGPKTDSAWKWPKLAPHFVLTDARQVFVELPQRATRGRARGSHALLALLPSWTRALLLLALMWTSCCPQSLLPRARTLQSGAAMETDMAAHGAPSRHHRPSISELPGIPQQAPPPSQRHALPYAHARPSSRALERATAMVGSRAGVPPPL